VTETQTALARRAVACKGWRWMPGMRWIVIRAAPLEDYAGRIAELGRRVPDGPGLPDLTDPATVGCLLALVREAWGQEPTGFVVPTHAGGWSYYTRLIAADWYAGDTEAEALVAALESAP